MYKRKTSHNYSEFHIETQETYLNLRYQVGYLEAGYYLRHRQNFIELVPLSFHMGVLSSGIGLAVKELKKSGLLK